MTQLSFRFWRHLGHRHLSATVVTSLVLWLSLSVTSIAHAQERVGQFCPDCMDQASAQLVAESMAPPPASGPGCDDFIPFGLGDDSIAASSDEGDDAVSCTAPVRRVFLANHHTGMVYAFDVWTEGSLPNAAPAAMSAEEQLLAEHAIEVRLAWDALIENLAEQGASSLVSEFRRVRRVPEVQSSGSSGFDECPSGTALDTFLRPPGIPDLRSAISFSAELGLTTLAAPQRRTFIRRLSGITVTTPFGSLGLQWEPSLTEPTLLIQNFPNSEAGSDNDRLAFELEVFTSIQGQIAVTAQFRPELSRVAGIAVLDFEQGATLDPCSAQKVLDAMQEAGASFHSPPGDPNPSPFPTDLVPPGAGFEGLCTRAFAARVDGQVLSTHTILVFCQQT